MKKNLLVFAISVALVFSPFATVSAGTVLKRILKNKELVVGITGSQPPLNATTRDGKIIGFDADIATIIGAAMGVEVKLSAMPFAKLLPALEAGTVDLVISGMTMTPKRNLKFAFIGPYYVSGKGVLTKLTNIAALQDPEGLNNFDLKVATLENSTSQTFVEKMASRAKLVKTKTYDDALDLLIKDKVDAVVADYPYCAFSAYRYRSEGLAAGKAPLTFEPLGIAMPEDTLLINWVQNLMLMLEGSGDLEKIGARWFQGGPWINDLPALEKKEK